jgi:hypothetical protein
MQRYAGSCSPEQVHVLQQVCDTVLEELRAKGNASTELLRDIIARRVMSQFYGDDFEPQESTRLVLQSFGIVREENEADLTADRLKRKLQTRVRSPERFRVLQQIFDAVWLEFDHDNRQSSVSSREQSRSTLATLVMQHLDHPELDLERAKQEVLRAFKLAGHC